MKRKKEINFENGILCCGLSQFEGGWCNSCVYKQHVQLPTASYQSDPTVTQRDVTTNHMLRENIMPNERCPVQM